jgi:hypothetical protein
MYDQQQDNDNQIDLKLNDTTDTQNNLSDNIILESDI